MHNIFIIRIHINFFLLTLHLAVQAILYNKLLLPWLICNYSARHITLIPIPNIFHLYSVTHDSYIADVYLNLIIIWYVLKNVNTVKE